MRVAYRRYSLLSFSFFSVCMGVYGSGKFLLAVVLVCSHWDGEVIHEDTNEALVSERE